jgi:hypothetical protein
MARVRKSTLSFDAITLEGSLLSSAKFAAIAERKAEEQSDADYNIPKGLTLRDETARYFRIGQALFRDLHASSAPSRHKTIEFTEQLLRGVFGFADIQPVHTPQLRDERKFPLTLEAVGGRVPVVVVPPSDDLDHASPSLSHDRRRSAASALQDWLNADDNAVWGLCTNGESLRLLRDNESLTRPAYLEADLRQIFEAEDYAGFSALWLVLHVSRFGRLGTLPTDCPLERWRESGSKEGLAARDRLRDGVKDALLALGTGFLTHPANTELSAQLRDSTWPIDEYFRQLLRLVYRLIFLLAAEDRKLLHIPEASAGQRKLYAEGYSLGALRDRAIRRSGWDNFHDRWSGLRVTFRALANGEPRLGLPALGGIFATTATPELDRAHISNRFLMEAIFRLAWLRDEGLLMPVNWRDMETEELGSVYESLLELTPRLSPDGREFKFAEGIQTKGNARKTSGSYYTPDSLVQVLLDSALDPILDRIESESEDPIHGLLCVTVIDPACGSGHFLLAAARRIAKRVVRLRCGDIHSEQDRLRALRDVVRSCIHGIDRNPMAVELTKVALWIETVEPGKPLGFLDANIRLGDSLLGIFSLDALRKGIPDAAYMALTGDDKAVAKDFEKRNLADKGELTRTFDFADAKIKSLELPPLAEAYRAFRQLPEDSVADIDAKRDRFYSASHDPRLQNLVQAADLYVAAFLTPKIPTQNLDPRKGIVPTTEDVWIAMRGGTVYGPRLGASRQLASDSRAFHWPLEFPDVISAGGFDVVLGNPPWDVLQLDEEEYFSNRNPDVAQLRGSARATAIAELPFSNPRVHMAFLKDKRIFEASSEYARESGRFPLTAHGRINTYALFAELFSNLIAENGSAGVITPSGIVISDGSKLFFQHLVNSSRLISSINFREIRRWFIDTDDRNPFGLLTIRNTNSAPVFAFFLDTPEEAKDPRRTYRLTALDLRNINPETATAPIFRSTEDALRTATIYRAVSGHQRPAMWLQLKQNVFTSSNKEDLSEFARSEGIQEEVVPIFRGAMFHQFDAFAAQYESGSLVPVNSSAKRDLRIVPADKSVSRTYYDQRMTSKRIRHEYHVAIRRIARSTDERTIICAMLPNVGTDDTASIVVANASIHQECALIANLNSLVLDYACAQKIGGTDIRKHSFDQLPIFPPGRYSENDLDFIATRVLELSYTIQSLSGFAHNLNYNGPPFPWNEDRRALLRAELDAWYARAYGLSRDELRYILDPTDVLGPNYPSETFRVLKEKELKLYKEFRTQRLVLGAWDRMETGELPHPDPYQPAPGTPANTLAASPRPVVTNQPSLQFAEADIE